MLSDPRVIFGLALTSCLELLKWNFMLSTLAPLVCYLWGSNDNTVT